MNAIVLHDAFVGAGCEGSAEPQPAVSIEAGAIWRQVYDAVTTKGGRYVQGGGCMTVGVAGLILGGGFGSFSKAYGMAAASLLEAEIVTADGDVKIANACSNPDLFWALKGGGGGFGVVTRVTLRTHALPEFFGGVFATIKATSDDAYRRLIAKTRRILREALFNPHWGEQIGFGPGGVVAISMVFQGLDQQQAEAVWRPFFDWVAASPQDFAIVSAPRIGALPAAAFLGPVGAQVAPGPRPRRRSPGRAGGQHLLGRQPARRRARSGTPTNPPGCPRRSSTPTSANASSTRCSPRRSIGRDAAFQQGACGRAAGGDRRGQGNAR